MKNIYLFSFLLLSIVACRKEEQETATASIQGFRLKGFVNTFSFADTTVLGLLPSDSYELSLSYSSTQSALCYYKVNHSEKWSRLDSVLRVDTNCQTLEFSLGYDDQHLIAYRSLLINASIVSKTDTKSTSAFVHNDIAQIKYADAMRGMVDVQLFDRWGRKIYSGKDCKFNDTLSTSIYAKDLPSGQYFTLAICGRVSKSFVVNIIH